MATLELDSVAGEYEDVTAASKAMGSVQRDVYVPDESRQAAYDDLYAEYSRLHDYFGRGDEGGGNDVLHRLRRIRNEASDR